MKRPGVGREGARPHRRLAPRSARPGTIRSTFITGFPGETEAEFNELLDFLDEAQLDRVGAFSYSPVEGASANELPGALPEEVREERKARLLRHQEDISTQRLERMIGRRIRVLVDEIDEEGAIARSRATRPMSMAWSTSPMAMTWRSANLPRSASSTATCTISTRNRAPDHRRTVSADFQDRLRAIVGVSTRADRRLDDVAPFCTDWRGRYTGNARCVVLPGSTEEVAAVVRRLRRRRGERSCRRAAIPGCAAAPRRSAARW
jgi:hypothetical protein